MIDNAIIFTERSLAKHDSELIDRFVEKCRGFEDLTFDKYQIQRIEVIAEELKAEVSK